MYVGGGGSVRNDPGRPGEGGQGPEHRDPQPADLQGGSQRCGGQPRQTSN